MKTILMIIILGTQNGLGGPVESPRITLQEFETSNKCEEARKFLDDTDMRVWEQFIISKCI